MTAPDPMPEPADGAALLEQTVLWRRVTGELDAAVAGAAVLAAEITAFWTDRAGQGWAQRLALVARELDRQAGVAADIVRLVTALADRVDEPDLSTAPDGAGPTATDPPIAGRGLTDRGLAVPGSGGAGLQGGTGDVADRPWTLPGVRLGGTDGARATERRGVVVPTLPDQPAG